MDLLSGNYENIFVMDDFNADVENINLKNFCDLYDSNYINKVLDGVLFRATFY